MSSVEERDEAVAGRKLYGSEDEIRPWEAEKLLRELLSFAIIPEGYWKRRVELALEGGA